MTESSNPFVISSLITLFNLRNPCPCELSWKLSGSSGNSVLRVLLLSARWLDSSRVPNASTKFVVARFSTEGSYSITSAVRARANAFTSKRTVSSVSSTALLSLAAAIISDTSSSLVTSAVSSKAAKIVRINSLVRGCGSEDPVACFSIFSRTNRMISSGDTRSRNTRSSSDWSSASCAFTKAACSCNGTSLIVFVAFSAESEDSRKFSSTILRRDGISSAATTSHRSRQSSSSSPPPKPAKIILRTCSLDISMPNLDMR
mmetsp:Transcript_177/g.329  ORF Transcript_177/g.329 Transcript_177/m.329 type:complete len:260 (-) Transcript_177:283-1062(-)